ncbi:MAG: pyridoxine/pyridoxamine 5'-phosphate oxidase [Acidimicrobiales bacterium]
MSFPPSWGLDAPPANPLELFAQWMRRADEAGVLYPAAATLSTSSPSGEVSARTVLLKEYDETALVFESESYSRKGVELAANPQAAMTLYWREVHRQICVTGAVTVLSEEVSDEMWARRGRPNQAASIVSHEGDPLESVEAELDLHAGADRLVQGDFELRRPRSYKAYGLLASSVEFWEGSASRLHRRLFYEKLGRDTPPGKWSWRRIQP